jgi:hypothetical protein
MTLTLLILIVGAMKSGTCYLYSLLSQHPEICECAIKEPEFFSEHQHHGLKVENYTELWKFDGSVHRYALEASTGYSRYPKEKNVPKNISALNLNPVLIYIVRNPFDRIESHYNFSRFVGFVDYSLPLDHEQYVYLSRYYSQLNHYMNYFSKDQFVVIDFEELVKSPEITLTRLCRRLDISDYDFDLANTINNGTPCKTRIENMCGQYKTLEQFINKGPDRLKPYIMRLPFLNKRIRYKLSSRQRDRVQKALKDDMKSLQKDFGIDVSKWGF